MFFRESCIVIKVRIKSGAAVLEAVEQTRAVPHCRQNEIRIRLGYATGVIAGKMRRGLSEGSQHQSIPIRENFLVASDPDPLFPGRVKLFPGASALRLEILDRYSCKLSTYFSI